MGHWWEQAKEIDVPQPETHFLNIDPPEEGQKPQYDISEAMHIVAKLGGEAFIKGGFRSAETARANHITEPSKQAINTTIQEFIDEMIMRQTPIGRGIYFREYLPLTWDKFTRADYHPEVRFFIRDGEVICHHLRTDLPDDPLHEREDITRFFDPDHASFPKITQAVHEYAEQVAATFNDGWWSVDFVLSTNYNWYLTDMAIDALQYIEKQDEWSNISNHQGDCKHDLENIYQMKQHQSST